MQLPLLTPDSTWTAPRISDLPSWTDAKRVAIDVETRDPLLTTLGPGVRRDGAYVVGVSFAIEDGPSAYLPFAHEGGGNIEGAWQYLRDQAKSFRGDLVGAGMQYDLDWLLESGVVFTPHRFRDVQVAEALCDELQFEYNLNAILGRRGFPPKDETLLRQSAAAWDLHPKKDLWRLPARFVGTYAERDAHALHPLLRRQERDIEDQELSDVYELECRLLPILVDMRRRGVRISFDRLDEVKKLSVRRELECLAKINQLTGCQLSVSDTNTPAALAAVLKTVGVELPKTPKSGVDSVTTAVLEAIDHPVGQLIRDAKKWNKLRNTFVKGRREHAVKGRVHPTFNQLRGDEIGARYGRLSCCDPNVQQEPKRDEEIGKLWRCVYLPDEGCEWVSADFSQQEPRWLTHYAELCKLPRAAEAAQRYRDDPDTDSHQMMADLTGLKRVDAKEIALAKHYGMGDVKFCVKTGRPTAWAVKWGSMREVAGPEGQALLDQFDAEAPYVRALSNRCKKQAEKVGYIITAGGRRCRFPKTQHGFDWCHLGISRLIQGSAADQTKQAMVDCDDAGIEIQLQVHDELCISSDRETAAMMAEIMRTCMPCNVPHKVDVEIGPSWGEAK